MSENKSSNTLNGETVPKEDIAELLKPIKPLLTGANSNRLEILEMFGQSELSYLDVLKKLFPDADKTKAKEEFTKFCEELNKAAEASGSGFRLMINGNSKSNDSEKKVLMVRINQTEVIEKVEKYAKAASTDISSAQDEWFTPPNSRPEVIKFFIVHSKTNKKAIYDMLEYLKPLLDNTTKPWSYEFEIDDNILTGEKWKDVLDEYMKTCQFGLLMVSRNMLASKYVRKEELPKYVGNISDSNEKNNPPKPFIGVCLENVFELGINMRGLEEYQLFLWTDKEKNYKKRSWSEIRGNNRNLFTCELFKKIEAYVEQILNEGMPRPGISKTNKIESPSPDAESIDMEDWEDALNEKMRRLANSFVDPENYYVKPRGKMTDSRGEQNYGELSDAFQEVKNWALEKDEFKPFFALLGDYGMGKTILTRKLARELFEEYENGKLALLPVLIDLKEYNAPQPDHGLEDILSISLRKFEPSNDERKKLIVALLKLAKKQKLLVIFDGLDEVLVRIDEGRGLSFINTLYGIASEALREIRELEIRKDEKEDLLKIDKENTGIKRPTNRVLVSCRTHYFRDMSNQSAFLVHTRSGKTEGIFTVMELAPFDEERITEYLFKRFGAGKGEVFKETLREIHNLLELSRRPMLLDRLCDLLDERGEKVLEKTVTTAGLYKELADFSLSRDLGKHTIAENHKLKLMAEIAGTLNLKNVREWSVDEMEDWIEDYFISGKLHKIYNNESMKIIKEDIRGASFLVRTGNDLFRFGHNSFFEYFLATALHRGLFNNEFRYWNIAPPSRETLDFLGELSAAEDYAKIGKVFENELPTPAKQLLFRVLLEYGVEKNAYSENIKVAFEGADFTDWRFIGYKDCPLSLEGSSFKDCRLENTIWKNVRLCGVGFSEADMTNADFSACELDGVNFSGVNLTGTEIRDCNGNFTRDNADRHYHFLSAPPNPGELYIGRHKIEGKTPMPDKAPAFLTGHSDSVHACAFSPDGNLALSASDDNTLALWDVNSGKKIRVFNGHSGSVYSCSFSPDGKYALSASSDNTLALWDIHSGKRIRVFNGHSHSVCSCAFSPDGIHTLSASNDKTLALWDVNSGKRVRVFNGHSDSVAACAFSPDGNRALSASRDNTLALWDIQSGKRIRVFNGHSDDVNACAFSPDGKHALSASDDKTLTLWNIHSGKRIRVFEGHSSSVYSCAFSPDGKHALSASKDFTLAHWDVNSGKRIKVIEVHYYPVLACAFSPDGNTILSASADRTLVFWDILSGKCKRIIEEYSNSLYSCAFSPDGNNVVSSSNNTLTLWDTNIGKRIRVLKGHSKGILACAFSPVENIVISASDDNTLIIWETHTGKSIRVLHGHSEGVRAFAFSIDGKTALSASDDHTLALWDIHSGKRIRIFVGHSNRVNACAFSPDGKHALSASNDKTLALWDVNSGKRIRVLNGHSNNVNACVISPDGNIALSASKDQTLALWDVNSGKRIRVFNGHSGSVCSCAFSPDGKHALSASKDFTLALWDIHSGKRIRVFEGHSDWVNACAFSPDGKFALSASYDNTLALWDVNTGEMLKRFSSLPDNQAGCIDYQKGSFASLTEEAHRYCGFSANAEGIGAVRLPPDFFGPVPTYPAIPPENPDTTPEVE